MRTGEQPLDHVAALDGLRFIAAAIVLVGHSWNCIAKPLAVEIAVRQSVLTIFINGYGAVQLFFVLSGFCLAGSADRARNFFDLVQFYTRRVFRIHPPYMYALLLAWLASFFYDTSKAGGGLTPDALRTASVHLPVDQLLPYFMYPSHAADQLGPAWTLFVEMNFSFLLPFMLWLTRRTHWTVLMAVSLYPLLDPGRLPSFLNYAFHFAMGIAIFQERARLGRWLAGMPRFGQAGFLCLGLGVFAVSSMFDLVFGAGFSYALSGLAISGVGGSLLLCSAVFFPMVNGALCGQALVYGGRRSYSFYLLHAPVMFLLTRTISGQVGLAGGSCFIALVFVATTAAATVSFSVIERPSIRLGNALCRAIAGLTRGTAQFSRLAR